MIERDRRLEDTVPQPGGRHMRLAGYPMALILLLAASAPVRAGVGLPEIGSIQIGPHRVHVLNDSMGLRRGRNTLTVHVPDLPPGHGVTLELHGPQGEVVEVPLRPLRVLGDPGAGHGSLTGVAVADASSGSGARARVEQAHDHGRDATTHPAETHGAAAPADAAQARSAHADHAHGATPPGPVADGDAAHRHTGHGSPPHDENAPGVTGHDATTAEAAVHGDAPHEAGHGGVTLAGYAVRGSARLPSTGAWQAVLTVGDGQGAPLTGEFRADVTADGPNPLYLGLMGFLTGGTVLYGVIQRRRGEGRP